MADYPFPKAVDYENLTAKALKGFDPTGWLIQPKWDGCAMVVYVNNGQAWAVTASGKPVKSCDHIIKYVEEHLGRGVYAMEVWKPATLFQDISGKFRSHSPQTDLVARIFDGWMETSLTSRLDPYHDRIERIYKHLPFAGPAQTAALMGEHFTTWDKAWDLARWWQAQGGYDGCILRNPEAQWVEGRSKRDLIKLKPLQDYDLRVRFIATSTGEKSGRPTVALGCAWKDNQTQWVATGLTHAEQANPEAFMGRIILVRGMGLTGDGFIREPRYAGLRDDKLEADY